MLLIVFAEFLVASSGYYIPGFPAGATETFIVGILKIINIKFFLLTQQKSKILQCIDFYKQLASMGVI